MHQETITIRGDVTLRLFQKDGTIETREHKNLVVNGGKTLIAKLLGNDLGADGDGIGAIGFGTSNTAAIGTQNGLQAQVLAKNVTVSFPAFNSVMFSATMDAEEGGISTYQELGLLSKMTQTLFSRVVIAPIVKSVLYRIQVDWTISFQ